MAPEFVRIVDEISIEVSGTVFVSQDHEYGLGGVAVSAINTRHPYNTIRETYTNKLGEFKLSLPKHTHARLELECHGHVFAAENDDGRKYLTEEGVVLTVAETNLRIADTNMSSFTIQTGVTDCALVNPSQYKLGEYELEVLLPGCPPDMFKINEFSEGISTFSLDLPAHACE